MNDILDGYAAAATPELIATYEGFDTAGLYAPVSDLLPRHPVRVADIGAGTGRDASWFAGWGHDVVAAEPVRELREAGMDLHRTDAISWLDDGLPDIAQTRKRGPFGLVTLNGVWHHLDDAARSIAMPHLGAMIAPAGLLVMSLRHGPGAPGRRTFPISTEDTIRAAAREDLALLRRTETGSIQPGNRAMGVSWTWLAFRKGAA